MYLTAFHVRAASLQRAPQHGGDVCLFSRLLDSLSVIPALIKTKISSFRAAEAHRKKGETPRDNARNVEVMKRRPGREIQMKDDSFDRD